MTDYVTEARKIMQRYKKAVVDVSDETAITVPELFDLWSPESVKYVSGDRKTYNGRLYKCIKDHTSQANWSPDKVPALWVVIDVEHAGTLEDPIPAASGMEYIKGKYYSESGQIYLMNRDGMAEGDKIVLHYLPSQLVGIYFELVEVT